MSNVVFISKVKSSDPLLDLPEKPISQYASLKDYAYQHCLDYNELAQFIPITPPQRKPLTDEEIQGAVREADLDWQKGWTLDEHESNRFTTLVRAIERAHGIGGQE